MKLVLFAALIAALPIVSAAQRAPDPADKPPLISVDGLPIGAIPPQTLPQGSCTAFLWSQTPSRALIAMLTTEPASIRFAPGGAVTDLVRVGQSGEGQLGFAATTDYAGGDFRATIDMDIVKRGDLADGAAVPSATFRLDRAGQDTIIVPAAGIIGCG